MSDGFKQHWTTAFGDGLRREIDWVSLRPVCGLPGLTWFHYASRRRFVTCGNCLRILRKWANTTDYYTRVDKKPYTSEEVI